MFRPHSGLAWVKQTEISIDRSVYKHGTKVASLDLIEGYRHDWKRSARFWESLMGPSQCCSTMCRCTSDVVQQKPGHWQTTCCGRCWNPKPNPGEFSKEGILMKYKSISSINTSFCVTKLLHFLSFFAKECKGCWCCRVRCDDHFPPRFCECWSSIHRSIWAILSLVVICCDDCLIDFNYSTLRQVSVVYFVVYISGMFFCVLRAFCGIILKVEA